MASQKVSFENRSGDRLSGIVETPEGPILGWALFAHCFTCSKTSLAATRISRGMAGRGIGVLRFDFTGLGESDGDFSQTGFSSNVSDLLDAAAWMEREGRPITLLVGHSLGGSASVVATIELASVKAVVTLGSPSDAAHVVHQFEAQAPQIEADGEAAVDLGGRPFVVRRSFLEDVRSAKVREAAAALSRPLLVMHSPVDDIVGIDNATGLFTAARHPKSFVSLDTANHLLSDADDAAYVVDVIAGWSRRYLPGPETTGTVADDRDNLSGDIHVAETGAAGPYQNAVTIEGRAFLADEPVSMGGAGTGPDPYQWVTAGLGACTSMTLRMYAERKGWPLERVQVALRHRKDADPRDGAGAEDKVDVFTREISVDGPLDAAQRARLLEIADKCPVHRTLERGSVVQSRLT
ncbi:MAG: bifunctional alpha/beta hydrolase/OsmC family protein [Pseudomonadota bacterium]